MTEHGREIRRFKKSAEYGEQILIVYEDGCIESVITSLMNRGGSAHTAEMYRWDNGQYSVKTLAESGYVETFDDIL